jgi:hypothetical protein
MAEPSAIEESRRIREWLLGILGFAITLERCEPAVAVDLAAEMDRLGSDKGQSGFSYFTRTSAKLCDCIVAKRDLDKLALLRLYIGRSDDDRLRRAFERVVSKDPMDRDILESKIVSTCGKAYLSDSFLSCEIGVFIAT